MTAQQPPMRWRASLRSDAVVTDAPADAVQGADEIEWYGGYLVAESISAEHRPLIIAAPELLEALGKLRKALDLIDPMRPLQYAQTMELMRQCADAAIAKARGQ